MKPGPREAARIVVNQFDSASPPINMLELLARLCHEQGWAISRDIAYEQAEGWLNKFYRYLVDLRQECIARGQFCAYEFNSSSDSHVQGSTYVEPIDTDETKQTKKIVADSENIRKLLNALTAREFEYVCAGFLHELGVVEVRTTQHSNDKGFDFIGQLSLSISEEHTNSLKAGGDFLLGSKRVWILWQAKHYKEADISTFDFREFIGAVSLLRSGMFWRPDAFVHYGDSFKVRICDPVITLYFTSGSIHRKLWDLFEDAGVIPIDGNIVAKKLARNGVAMKNGIVDEGVFREWLSELQMR